MTFTPMNWINGMIYLALAIAAALFLYWVAYNLFLLVGAGLMAAFVKVCKWVDGVAAAAPDAKKKEEPK